MFGEFPYSHIFGNIFFIIMKFEISSMFARDFSFSLLYYLEVSAVLWNVLRLILWICVWSILANALCGICKFSSCRCSN